MTHDLRPIPGYPHYFADESGGIWSAKSKVKGCGGVGGWTIGPPRLMTPHLDTYGYPRVRMMHESGKAKPVLVSTAVAAAFFGPRPPGMQVAHLSGIKTDNRLVNLAYVTCAENIRHRDAVHCTTARGERQWCAKLTEMQAAEIRRRARNGEPQKLLAEEFGVSVPTVSFIKLGQTWKHLE